jgi:Flp pilus assembly pilin Flp
VTVYKNISGVWTQIGNNIEVQNANTLSLSSDGTIIAIGIRYPSSIESGKSKVTVYENISGVWTQLGLDFNGESGNLSPELSLSLSSDGTILAIGDTAIRHDLGPVRVYKNISGVWTQVGESIKANEFDELGRFGFPVRLSADGSIIAIGARESDVNGNDSGQVRIYKNISQVWTQIGSDINGEAIRDVSGASISLTSDGSKLAIGAPANDGNGEGSGHVRVFDLSGILSSDSFVLANFSVYPNPASSMVTITLQKGLLLEKVNIYNTLGQLVKTEKKNSIAVNSLTKGSYFFEVVTNEGKAVKTIVIH